MRHIQWNGYFACTYCMIRGRRLALGPNSTINVFPYSSDVVERRNEQIPVFAEQAVRGRRYDPDAHVYGVKGPSLLYYMVPSLVWCMGIDAMHGIFLGLSKLLTCLWFDASYAGQLFSVHELIDIVDQRLRNIKPPSNIQRIPHSIKTQLSFWKALEYKLWFLYYSLPVLLDILPDVYWRHHCKVVSAIRIVFQESVSFEQIEAAEELLHAYVSDFEHLYGLRFMSINLHHLIHLPQIVRKLGPLWVFNCFVYEDLNGSIAGLIHGSRHAATQVCSSVSAFLTLPQRLNELDRYNPVRLFCESMLTGGQMRFKVALEISRNLQIIGNFQPCNPIPPVIGNALETDFNILNGRCRYFEKLRKNGILYVSDSYARSIQKLPCYAVVRYDVPYLSKILYFICWTPCGHGCPPNCNVCLARYFCIVELYERVVWEAHTTPGVRLSYLNRVTPTGVIRAFPVEALSMLCFFMNIDGDYYIASPVNTLEVE